MIEADYRLTRVFLSSTAKDLGHHREVVADALRTLGYVCIQMEDFNAQDAAADDYCRRKVGSCDLLIALVGPLHGSCPPKSTESFTEREYATAKALNKSRLTFVANEQFKLPADLIEPDEKRERQKRFRARVKEDRIAAFFTTPQDLGMKVVSALTVWEKERARLNEDTKGQSKAADISINTYNEPNRGGLIPKMCNRGPQDNAFRVLFPIAKEPQVYFVPGIEGDSHESLVERLKYRVEQRSSASVEFQIVQWSYDGAVEERYDVVRYNLFERFCPGEELVSDLSPERFQRVLAALKPS